MATSIELRTSARSASSAAEGRPPRRYRWRRALIASTLGRVFRRVGGRLCEPGGLPTYGIHRVLICRPNHRLGNTILLSPLIQEIEGLYPGAEIDIVASDVAVTLYADRFHVRRIFALPRKIARHLPHTVRLLLDLRFASYDLAIDACTGSQSGRLILALARARFKLGFPDEALIPASAWYALSWPAHLAHRSVFLLRTAYAGTTADIYPPLEVELTPREKDEAAKALAKLYGVATAAPHPIIGVFADATGAKRYQEAWWIQFLRVLQRESPDVKLVDLVGVQGVSRLGERFVPFYTQNPRHLAAMIACMDGFISADCGVMHLAAGSGTPTLGLFSTTDPAKYSPYGGANAALYTQDMDASTAAMAAVRWFARVRREAAANSVDPRESGSPGGLSAAPAG